MTRVGAVVLISAALIAVRPHLPTYSDSPQTQVRERIQSAFADSNAVRIQGRLVDGTQVRITVIRTAFTPETFKYSTDIPRTKWTGWGTAGVYDPRTVVTAVNVWAGEHPLYVNLSAFSDLANPHDVLFEDLSPWPDQEHASFRIIISGGGAAGSYVASLYFNSRTIERRVVYASEFQSTQREETIYTDVDWGRAW